MNLRKFIVSLLAICLSWAATGTGSSYDKFVKDATLCAKGDFANIYFKKDKLYMEYPVSQLGRRMLVAGTVKSVSNPGASEIGRKYNDPFHVTIDLKDSLIMISTPSVAISSNDPEMAEAIRRNTAPKVTRFLPVDAWNADSTAVVFEITSLVNNCAKGKKSYSIVSSASSSSGSSYKEGKATAYSDIKSFADNASIVVTDAAASYTVSFLLLPKEPMRPRVKDNRIGTFTTMGESSNPRFEINGEKDGARPYCLANHWRLEPVDSAAWMAGKLVDVKKPVVWYVDDSFPQAWKSSIKAGILRWNRAFEAMGFSNVMQVRDFPSAEEDSEFDPDNLKYNCIRYVPNNNANAMGPSWVDPMTGEIINASVLVYNDIVRLISNWRFLHTAQVDERVRSGKLTPEVFDESMRYVICHEIGHTLGLLHNMSASNAIPVDSLRSASFTAKYGTTASIMDYARFNYVAQPQDKGVKLTPPDLGVYDYYAIKWLYSPVPGASDMWEEAKELARMVDEKDGDSFYRYGEQQNLGLFGCQYDCTALAEDLGDDPIKAGEYGISNLKYILSNMEEWVTNDEDYSRRKELHTQLAFQFYRYMNNVVAQVGGMKLYQSKEGSSHIAVEPLPKDVQSASLKWVFDQMRESSWINNYSLTKHFQVFAPQSNFVAGKLAYVFYNELPVRVIIEEANSPRDGSAYTIKDYYDDLFKYLFASSIAGKPLATEEKTMQRHIIANVSRPAITQKNATKKFAGEDEWDGLLSDFGHESCGLGEGDPSYRMMLDTSRISEIEGYHLAFMNKVKALASKMRKSGPKADRAHYEYLFATCGTAVEL